MYMFVWEMYEDDFLSFSKKNESRENNFLGWGELEEEKIIFRQLIFFGISKKMKVGRIIFFVGSDSRAKKLFFADSIFFEF